MAKMSERRKEAGDQLLKRTQESYDTRESSGKVQTIFKPELNIPSWYSGEGEHLLDIIPYIATKNYPDPRVKAGDIVYHLVAFVHYEVGAGDLAVICPMRTYHNQRKCPICEKQKELRNQGLEWDHPDVKALEPKKRAIYNLVCYDTEKEEDKGVQVWDSAFWNFERHVVELAQKPRGGGFIAFSDPDAGKSVWFKRKGKKAKDTEYLGHKFEDRGYAIPDEILDSTFTLEDIIEVLDYDEIAELIKVKGEEAPTAGRQRGTRQQPSPEEAPPPEETAGRSRLRQRSKPPEEAQPQQEPDVPESVEGDITGKCPAKGGTFGEDFDKLDFCNKCPDWDNCSARAQQLEEAEKSQQSGTRTRQRLRPGR